MNTLKITPTQIDNVQTNDSSSTTVQIGNNSINKYYYTSKSDYSGASSIERMHTTYNIVGDKINNYPFMELVHCNYPNRLIKMSEI